MRIGYPQSCRQSSPLGGASAKTASPKAQSWHRIWLELVVKARQSNNNRKHDSEQQQSQNPKLVDLAIKHGSSMNAWEFQFVYSGLDYQGGTSIPLIQFHMNDNLGSPPERTSTTWSKSFSYFQVLLVQTHVYLLALFPQVPLSTPLSLFLQHSQTVCCFNPNFFRWRGAFLRGEVIGLGRSMATSQRLKRRTCAAARPCTAGTPRCFKHSFLARWSFQRICRFCFFFDGWAMQKSCSYNIIQCGGPKIAKSVYNSNNSIRGV